jgi:hypothetical protein
VPDIRVDVGRDTAIQAGAAENAGKPGASFVLLDQCITLSHELDCSGRFEDRTNLGDAAKHDPPITEHGPRDSFASDPVLKTKNGRVVADQRRD